VTETWFPHFPFSIPSAPGIANWWDIFWWCFQLAVMTALLLGLRRIGLGMDERRQQELPPALREPGQVPSQPPGRGPSLPG
jgi:hypothetical protein